MRIKEFHEAESLDGAYAYVKEHDAKVLGGGAFLNFGKGEIDYAVDISNLGLDYIRETDSDIEIGAMTKIREMERNKILSGFYDGILPETAKCIMGVQIRNTATIGGTVWGRFGFSDMLSSLLVLDSYAELYKAGRMPIEEFIESGINKDILVKIIIKKTDMKARHMNFKNTGTSFSTLNTAVSNTGGSFKIAVGARPNAAKLAHKAMEFISGITVNEQNAAKAAEIASEELSFGSDVKGSSSYRKQLCSVFVKRCIMEVAL